VENDPQSGAPSSPPLLELKGLTKRFPGVIALNAVDLTLSTGEIHALVGENGAGKSTLIKLLCGTYLPDAGEIWLGGARYQPESPFDALAAGIRVVYQEFNLLPFLSVAENLLFGNLPRRFGLSVDYRALYERARTLLDQVGLDVDPQTPVERLGTAQRQLLEIGKALAFKGRLLILDEPTATLTPREIARLFEIIQDVRNGGVTVIFVSHHLNEIFELCDAVTVLRNGRHIATLPISSTRPSEIVHLMVGRELEAALAARSTKGQPPAKHTALRVQDLRFRGNPHGISFTVQYGEILGFAGLVGSGRTETLRAIFGADPPDGGEIYRDDQRVQINAPSDAVKQGICLLTENRKEEGLVLPMPVRVNLTLTDLSDVSLAGLLDRRREKVVTRRWVNELDLRIASPEQAALDLSGGNQQKLVMAKWLFRDAEVLMLDEPTRGIDVGAKAEIHDLLHRLADSGKAIVIVSSEVPELVALCNRILVLWRGRLAGEVRQEEFSEKRILALACGESPAISNLAVRSPNQESSHD
jgi:ribose transport system ATP-binding protein